MAVAISQTANPAGVSASGNVATYSSQSIGAAHLDRIVYLLVGSELASASPDSATIDFGGGDTAMSAGSLGNFGAVYARIFYLRAPTGTTATFKVTFGANPSNTQNHVAVYRVVGGALTLASSGNDGSTDMDATDRLAAMSITVPAGGGLLAIVAGATDTDAKSWGGATEDIDADAGAFRFTTATRTGSFSGNLTCTGGSNGEDGALSWVILNPSASITADAGSYAVTGTDATLRYGRKVAAAAGSYDVTGAAATLSRGQEIIADGGSYAVSGTDASLKHGKAVAAGGGSYAVGGTDAALLLRRIVLAESGSYQVAGSVAGLALGKRIAADGGSYAIDGTDAAVRVARVVAAAAGSYAVTGNDAALVHNTDRTIAAEAGSYLVSGTDAALILTGGEQGAADRYVGFHKDLGRFMH